MGRGFQRSEVDRETARRQVEDPFPVEVGMALNAPANEEPFEEAKSGGRLILTNSKLVSRTPPKIKSL
jgi:hypothetical protein